MDPRCRVNHVHAHRALVSRSASPQLLLPGRLLSNRGCFGMRHPQWSGQKRPTVVRSKPANGCGPGLRCCTLPFAFLTSLISEISKWRAISSSKPEKISFTGPWVHFLKVSHSSGCGFLATFRRGAHCSAGNLVLQLRGPHLRIWPWWRRRSSIAVTAALSPSSFPQSSTGLFDVTNVLVRS